jgi:hypothetical protein
LHFFHSPRLPSEFLLGAPAAHFTKMALFHN